LEARKCRVSFFFAALIMHPHHHQAFMGLSRLTDHEEVGGRCERSHKKLREPPEKAAKYVSAVTYPRNNAVRRRIAGAYRKSRIIATSGLSAGGIG
jgi:hypothetical protein